jgi:nitrite reductase/ring-hydroxylating ferredoxin subunit
MLTKLFDKGLLPPGEFRSFKVQGQEVLVLNLSGKFYCLSGRCVHAGAPLAEGTLEGEVLTCPWHYSQYNVTTGEVLRGPADKPLHVYKAEEKENDLYIDL